MQESVTEFVNELLTARQQENSQFGPATTGPSHSLGIDMHVSQVSTSTRGSLCTSDGGAAAVVRSNTSQAGNITIVRPYVRTVHSNNSKVGRGEQTQETSQQAMHPPTHRMNVTQTARNSDKQSRHARTSRTNEQQQRTNERRKTPTQGQGILFLLLLSSSSVVAPLIAFLLSCCAHKKTTKSPSPTRSVARLF